MRVTMKVLNSYKICLSKKTGILCGFYKFLNVLFEIAQQVDLVFPVQNTTQKYGNGYKGTFTYTSVTGNVVSLEAGGYVYLNSSSSDAQ